MAQQRTTGFFQLLETKSLRVIFGPSLFLQHALDPSENPLGITFPSKIDPGSNDFSPLLTSTSHANHSPELLKQSPYWSFSSFLDLEPVLNGIQSDPSKGSVGSCHCTDFYQGLLRFYSLRVNAEFLLMAFKALSGLMCPPPALFPSLFCLQLLVLPCSQVLATPAFLLFLGRSRKLLPRLSEDHSAPDICLTTCSLQVFAYTHVIFK